MRYVGWVLGSLFLTDGLLALTKRKDLVKMVNSKVGRRLPRTAERTLKKATAVNDTAMAAMGINNIIAGAGMVLVATLVGMRHARR